MHLLRGQLMIICLFLFPLIYLDVTIANEGRKISTYIHCDCGFILFYLSKDLLLSLLNIERLFETF
jgi:hypothetical protein